MADEATPPTRPFFSGTSVREMAEMDGCFLQNRPPPPQASHQVSLANFQRCERTALRRPSSLCEISTMCNDGSVNRKQSKQLAVQLPNAPGCSMLRAPSLPPVCIWVRVPEAEPPLISLAPVPPQAVWAALDKSISGAA